MRWHHQHYGHEFEQALGVVNRQGGLACCSPWGRKELDMTEQLKLKIYLGAWLFLPILSPTAIHCLMILPTPRPQFLLNL